MRFTLSHIVLGTALLFLCSACRRELPCRQGTRLPKGSKPASPPLAAVDRWDGRTVFYPSTNWLELAKLSIFEGFWPGIEVDEARRLLGEPGLYREDPTAQDWIYMRDAGEVSVSLVDQSSPPFYFIPRSWILEGHPRHGSLNDFFHPAVVEYIKSSQDRQEITIINNCGYPAVSATIQGGEVVRISWLDTPGSGPKQNSFRLW